MKATSRRRLLVSSVAMLLVAMIALGTATFAWFTSSTTATASGLNVMTVKASELVISKNDRAWGTVVDYGVAKKVLLPTSSANGTNWFEANAASKTAFTANSDGFKAIGNTANYVIKNELNVKNQGEATVNDVKITFSGLTSDYIRVALVEKTEENAVIGTFASSVYDKDGVAYDAASGTGTATTNIKPSKTFEISVGPLTKNQAKFYDLYVWFEGQDAQCYDSNAGQEVDDITFTVTGATASQV